MLASDAVCGYHVWYAMEDVELSKCRHGKALIATVFRDLLVPDRGWILFSSVC